jgi:nucleoside-diphosphate-sugar epimerase
MNILLCGASGFVGRSIRDALESNGHSVVGAGSRFNTHNQIVVDYAVDTAVDVWLPRLANIDAVINAVGVLRDTRRRPIDAVHTRTPIALFDACATVNIRRVIHISALGIGDSDADNPTRYASTKRAADAHLLALHADGKLNATVLRPSIVFGKGGASSQLFAMLSKLPLLVLPQPVLTAQVQPIAVQDLARGVALLVDQQDAAGGVLECVGESALPLVAFIASLRAEQGRQPERVLALPQWMTALSVRLGDQIPVAPWCSETLALLAKDNVSSSDAFTRVLGNTRLPLDQFWRKAWL